MSFFSKILNSSAFGIDLSDRSIKVFQFQKKGKKYSFSYGAKEMPSGLIEDGEIKDFEKLSDLIKKAKNETKPNPIETDYVVCSLPESKCFFREINLPNMTLDEVNEAIKWEVEQQIPLSREEIYLDWYVLNEEKSLSSFTERAAKTDKRNNKSKIPQTMKIFLSAAPRKLVNSYVKVLKLAGLKPIIMEIESAATVRALVSEKKYNNSTLIIDLGETRTSFIIFKPPIIRFTRNIDFSGTSLTNKISKELRMKYEEAEKLKEKWGLDKEKGNGSLIELLEPLLGDLFKNIQESLNYYSEHFNKNFSKDKINPVKKNSSDEVKKIILCGGGANLKGLDDWLASKAKKEVEKIELLDNNIFLLPGKKKLSFPKNFCFACYATAIGLALRRINSV